MYTRTLGIWNCYYNMFRCHKIQYSEIYITMKGHLQLSLQLSHNQVFLDT